MASVDFAAWVTPHLSITLGGRDYSCPPPSVATAAVIVAFAAVAEIRMGIVEGPADPAMVAICDAHTGPLGVLTLTQDVWDRMAADGVDTETRARVAYYGMLFWAHGKARADWIAAAMWSPEVTDTAPKAKARRRPKSGRSTASASPTKTACTPTTGSPPT